MSSFPHYWPNYSASSVPSLSATDGHNPFSRPLNTAHQASHTLPPLHTAEPLSFVVPGHNQPNSSLPEFNINSAFPRANRELLAGHDTAPRYTDLSNPHIATSASASRALPPPIQHEPAQRLETSEVIPLSDAPAQPKRKPRTRQPSELLWTQVKPTIEGLYIDQKLSLPEVIQRMQDHHDFNASEKMYKDKFKEWQWFKNLPQKKAVWMLKRLHENRPQKVIFEYGNQKWDEKRLTKVSQRIQRSMEATEGVAWSPSAPTPSDIQYSTALSVCNGTPRDPAEIATPFEEHRCPAEPKRLDFDSKPTTLDLSRVTLADLRLTVQSAATLASSGMLEQAEEGFREGLLGFRHLLSPTHDETLRAAYHLSSFYSNTGRMEEAYVVLNWMTSTHAKKFGSKHNKTILHYVRVVDLLQSWHRKEQAEIIVYKLLDSAIDADDDSDCIIIHDRDEASPMIAEGYGRDSHYLSRFDFSDTATISHQLKLLDMALAVNISGPLDLLPRIIEHCESMPTEFAAEHVKAASLLARVHLGEGKFEEAQRVLSDVRSRVTDLLELKEHFPSKSAIETAQNFAFALFRAKNESGCQDVLDEIISILEVEPIYDDSDKRMSLLIDSVWSFAAEFNRISTWEKCEFWMERGLGLVIKNGMGRSVEAKRFRDSLAQQRFTFRSSKHIDDLMDFSKGLFRIRLL